MIAKSSNPYSILTFWHVCLLSLFFLSGNALKAADCIDVFASGTQTSGPTLDLPTFLYSSSNSDRDGSSLNLSAGQYKDVNVDQNGSVTFTTSDSTYRLNKLQLDKNAKAYFPPGDYFIDQLQLDQGADIILTGTGTVRIYSNDISMDKNVNIANNDQYLIMVAYGDVSIDQKLNFDGVLYSTDKVEIEKNSSLTGSIRANEIDLGNKTSVNYDTDYINNADFNGMCSGSSVVTIDHYEIIHDAAGSTCDAETITLKACLDASCTTVSTDSVSVNLDLDGITDQTVTFTGTTTVSVNHTTEETVTFSLSDESVAPDNALVCDDGSGTSCDMTFSSASCPAPGACAIYFPDTISGHDSSSYLKIKNQGQVINDSDNILTLPSLDDETSGSHDSCQTVDCSVSGTTVPALTLPTFETTSATTDISLSSGNTTIGPGGDYAITEVDNLSVSGSASLTFSATASTYHIDDAVFFGNSNITFNPGIYWFNELEIIGSTNIIINGPVTLFVNGPDHHLDIEDDVTINTSGSAEDLVIVSYDKIHLKDNVVVKAVLYGIGSEVKTEDDAQLIGAISASGKVEIKDDSSVTYENVSNVEVGDICGGTPIVIDHIEITTDGTALTCLDETLVIKACADASCTTVSNSDVTVSLSATGGASTWSENPVTIPANSNAGVEIYLTHRIAETIILDATSSPVASNATSCNPVGCNLVFSEAGFILSLANQSSCSNSEQLAIQAVKLSETGTSCAPAYTGNQSVNFSFDYANPTTGTVIPLLESSSMAAATQVQNRSINFDASASANLDFEYRDAGQLSITVSDAGDNGLSDASVNTIITPPKLNIVTTDANASCTGPNFGGCTAFKVAGTSGHAASEFNLQITGVCNDDSVTPNFQLSNIALNANLVAPTGGNNAALGVASVDITNDGIVSVNQTVSEVGVFTITATPPDYMGQPIPSTTSSNIGRFTPARFLVSDNSPELADANDGCGFTYQDQETTFAIGWEPEITVTAVNSAGTTTVNYGGDGVANNDFWKLNSADYSGRTYSNQATPYPGSVSATLNTTTVAGQNNYDGVHTITFDNDGITHNKTGVIPQTTNDAPFNAQLLLTLAAASLTDTDGIFYDSDVNGLADNYDSTTITGTNIRWGRWNLENGYGSELQAIAMNATAEYFDGNQFVTTTTDNCTPAVTLNLSNYTGNLSSGETTTSQGAISSGVIPISLTAPGLNNTGSVLITITTPSWLQYDYDGDGSLEDAQATATFGIYEGRRPIIIKRQTY